VSGYKINASEEFSVACSSTAQFGILIRTHQAPPVFCQKSVVSSQSSSTPVRGATGVCESFPLGRHGSRNFKRSKSWLETN
jgi:hypothetical protein